MEYVLGYTGANDVSFRYHQMAVSQWGFSKSFDNTNPLGPCLVSAKSIPDPQKIPLKCVVNGQTVQDGTTAYVVYFLDQLLSADNRLAVTRSSMFGRRSRSSPKELRWNQAVSSSRAHQRYEVFPRKLRCLYSQLLQGVGFVRKPPLYLKGGDKMLVWVGNGVGTLVNDVKEEGPDAPKAKL